MHPVKSVLCIDNNADNLELTKFFFEQAGYQVADCLTIDNCLDILGKTSFSAVVSEYKLPGIDGADLCRSVKSIYPQIPFVIFTADAQTVSRIKSLSSGASAYLIKPNDLERVVTTVDGFINQVYSI